MFGISAADVMQASIWVNSVGMFLVMLLFNVGAVALLLTLLGYILYLCINRDKKHRQASSCEGGEQQEKPGDDVARNLLLAQPRPFLERVNWVAGIIGAFAGVVGALVSVIPYLK